MIISSLNFMQLSCLCEFPSKEFYGGRLETSPTVAVKLDRLNNFWPRGPLKPFVFVNVVGNEDEHHTGQDGAASVGMESKRNNKEAKKIVSVQVPVAYGLCMIFSSFEGLA